MTWQCVLDVQEDTVECANLGLLESAVGFKFAN